MWTGEETDLPDGGSKEALESSNDAVKETRSPQWASDNTALWHSEGILPITDAEYENVDALMTQFCRVPALSELCSSFAHAQESLPEHSNFAVDLRHVCRSIHLRTYHNIRHLQKDLNQVLDTCIQHNANQKAVSKALYLRDYLDDIWEEYMIPSNVFCSKRQDDRKKRIATTATTVLSDACLARTALAVRAFLKMHGRVDSLDQDPILSDDCSVLISNLQQLQQRLDSLIESQEYYCVENLVQDLQGCLVKQYSSCSMRDPNKWSVVNHTLDRLIGKIVVDIYEAHCRGVTQSSVWASVAAVIWARPTSQDPYWPALVLGISAPSEKREAWHASLTERNERRLPKAIHLSVQVEKVMAENATSRQQVNNEPRTSYFLVELMGTHEFHWVKESDVVDSFALDDKPNKSKTDELGSDKTYSQALEKGICVLEEFEAQLNDPCGDTEHGGYSYSVLFQSDDNKDQVNGLNDDKSLDNRSSECQSDTAHATKHGSSAAVANIFETLPSTKVSFNKAKESIGGADESAFSKSTQSRTEPDVEADQEDVLNDDKALDTMPSGCHDDSAHGGPIDEEVGRHEDPPSDIPCEEADLGALTSSNDEPKAGSSDEDVRDIKPAYLPHGAAAFCCQAKEPSSIIEARKVPVTPAGDGSVVVLVDEGKFSVDVSNKSVPNAALAIPCNQLGESDAAHSSKHGSSAADMNLFETLASTEECTNEAEESTSGAEKSTNEASPFGHNTESRIETVRSVPASNESVKRVHNSNNGDKSKLGGNGVPINSNRVESHGSAGGGSILFKFPASTERSRDEPDESPFDDNTDIQTETESSVSVATEGQPFAGRHGACGNCETCVKEPCAQCARCTSGRDVECFQKMCIGIPVEAKGEEAVGFPGGWKFYFGKRREYTGGCRNKQIVNLWIISPGNRLFRSVDAAAKCYQLQNKHQIKKIFYDHVGLKDFSIESPSAAADIAPNPRGRGRPRKHALSQPSNVYHEGSDSRKKNNGESPDRPTVSSTTTSTPDVCRKTEQGTEVGSWVYARWENREYYFAEIVAIKRKPLSRFDHFSLLFFDGDFIEHASRRSFCTATQYKIIFGKGINPPPKGHAQRRMTLMKDISSAAESAETRTASSPMSLEELLGARCEECENCQKDDCARCASCLANGASRSRVCIQRMCCGIPTERKAQPMPACSKFPNGWRFVIDPMMDGYRKGNAPMKEAEGLKILSPNGSFSFYSVERAKGQLHNRIALKDVDANEFYKYIGAVSRTRPEALAMQKQRLTGERPTRKSQVEPSSGAKWACGRCENCAKESCGQCAPCLSGRGVDCFQNVCFEIPVEEKVKEAVGFPTGWYFYFGKELKYSGKEANRYKLVPKLWIRSPQNRVFRSVDAAVSFYKIRNGLQIEHTFYEYVGLGYLVGHSTTSGSSSTLGRKRPLSGINESMVCSSKPHIESRVYCRRIDRNWGWGVVAESHVETGETQYSVRLEKDNTLLECVDNERIMTEAQYKSRTKLNPPLPPNDSDGDSSGAVRRKRQWLSGGAVVEADAVDTTVVPIDDVLLGQRFCFKWTDLSGQKKLVAGIVAACETQEGNCKIQHYGVTYGSQSRQLANLMTSGLGLAVPETQMLSASLVLGGCVLHHNEKIKVTEGIPRLPSFVPPESFYWQWVTPIVRHLGLVDTVDGSQLPRLTLVLKGFQLELNVKQSTIPGAGLGVFLSCKVFGNVSDKCFKLEPGELVDLGIYAPFRIHDKKNERVFFAKNFVFSHRCEEWVFNAGDEDYHLDITDDATGELHLIAKSSVLAYVNETNDQALMSVRAEHDPEGSVHYLLGHSYADQGSFELVADSTETELFVNYGEEYERVRIRNNYSFVSDEEQAAIRKEMANQDTGDVTELNRFEAPDVDASAKFFIKVFTTSEHDASKFSPKVLRRALVCAVVLQRRAYHLWFNALNRGRNENEASVALPDIKAVSSLVSLLLRIMPTNSLDLRQLQASGDFEEIQKRVLASFFSSELDDDGMWM